MDQFSFKVAQSLINNDGPAIEYTLIGPTIQFNTQNTFVITGGSINASLNNKTISMNSVRLAEKGDILKIGAITKGARGYLTFGHSINVPSIAESYATHTRSSIGGFKGRKLLANDVITVKIMTLKKTLERLFIYRTIYCQKIILYTFFKDLNSRHFLKRLERKL